MTTTHDFRGLILRLLADGPRPLVVVKASFSPEAARAYRNLLGEGLIWVYPLGDVVMCDMTDDGRKATRCPD